MFQVFSFKVENLEELGKAHREVAGQRNSGFVMWGRNTITFIMAKVT